jgi:hypothetical protein
MNDEMLNALGGIQTQPQAQPPVAPPPSDRMLDRAFYLLPIPTTLSR